MPLHLNTCPDDTYDEAEAQALRQVVASTLVADPRTAIQAAVTNAQMLLQQNWTCEARQLLAELGLTPAAAPLMRLA